MKRKNAKIDKEELRVLVENKATAQEIANIFKCTTTAVFAAIRRMATDDKALKDGAKLSRMCSRCNLALRIERCSDMCRPCERILEIEERKKTKKQCTRCLARKNRSEFYGENRSVCRACTNSIASKRARDMNPAQMNERRKRRKEVRMKCMAKRVGTITSEVFRYLSDNDGKCAICDLEISFYAEGRAKVAVIDHCHKTGLFRGVICPKCNSGIGLMKDDVGALERAVEYLKKGVASDYIQKPED